MTIEGGWTMRRLGQRTLRGPNVHHFRTVCVLTVECGALADLRVADVDGDIIRHFTERFADLPSPHQLHGLEPRLGFGLHDADTAIVPELLLEAILTLEHYAARCAGRFFAPKFARVASRDDELGHVDLVWESATTGVSHLVSRAALAGLLELLAECDARIDSSETEGVWDSAFAALRKRCDRTQWSALAALFAAGAREAGFPHEGLAGNYIRLGEGNRQRVLSEEVLQQALRSHAPSFELSTVEHATVADVKRWGSALLDAVVDPIHEGPVPRVTVLGATGTRAVARSLDRYLRAKGVAVGRVAGNRAVILGRAVRPTERGRSPGADFVLRDPRVALFVRGDSPRRVTARGLGLDHVDVMAWLGARQEDDPEATWPALEVSIRATTGPVVVDGRAREFDKIREVVGPGRIITIGDTAPDGSWRVGRGVEDRERIELWRGGRVVSSLALNDFLRAGRDVNPTNLRRALFAAGLAVGLGFGGPEPDVP